MKSWVILKVLLNWVWLVSDQDFRFKIEETYFEKTLTTSLPVRKNTNKDLFKNKAERLANFSQ